MSLAELQEHQLSTPPLEQVVEEFHQHFPPWSSRPEFCKTCSHPGKAGAERLVRDAVERSAPGSASPGVSLSEYSASTAGTDSNQTSLIKSLASAVIPTPSAGACFSTKLDLGPQGLPGLQVQVGIDGTLDYGLCTKCFSWKFQVHLGFQFGVRIFGHGLMFEVAVSGEVELKELVCGGNEDAPFCKYIDAFLPVGDGRRANRYSECFSHSPFDVVTAFLLHQWRAMQWCKGKNCQNKYLNSVGVEMQKISREMKAIYPKRFVKAGSVPHNADEEVREAFEVVREPVLMYPKNVFTRVGKDEYTCRSGEQNYTGNLTAADCFAKCTKTSSGCKTVVFMDTSCDVKCRTYTSSKCDQVERDASSCDGTVSTWSKERLKVREAFVWVIEEERRICISDKKPPAQLRLQERLSGDLLSVGPYLKSLCSRTLELSRVNKVIAYPPEADIPDRVWLMTADGQSLELSNKNHSVNAAWVKALHRLAITDGVPTQTGKDRFAVVTCNWAQLHNKDLDAPFCAVEGPASAWSDAWGSSWRLQPNASRIEWGESVGFRVGQNSELSVAVFDWQGGKTSNEKGRATIRVCDKPARSGMVVISETKICGKSKDADRVDAHASVENVNLMECMETCLASPDCLAIDYWEHYEWCDLFAIPCQTPGDCSKGLCSSFKVKQRGCDIVAAITATDVVTVERPLYHVHKKKLKTAGYVNFTVSFKPTPPVPDERFSKLRREAQALGAAFQMFLGKLPAYAGRLQARVTGTGAGANEDPHAVKIPYETLNGRYLARWDSRFGKYGAEDFVTSEDLVEVAQSKKASNATVARTVSAKCDQSMAQYSTHESVRCQLEEAKARGFRFNEWFGNTFRRYILGENRPCMSSPLSEKKWDTRIVNFKEAKAKSWYTKHPTQKIDFFAEFATSVGNLLVRAVADVQALFNIYFADDAWWDGDCSALKTRFTLPFEFGDDFPDEVLRAKFAWPQPYGRPGPNDKRPVTHRAGPNVGDQGEELTDKSNPFCWWPWANGFTRQQERVDFVTMTAPTGFDDGVRPSARLQASRVHPHIWCEMSRAARKVKFAQSTGPEQRRQSALLDGMLFRYRSACRQLIKPTNDEQERIWNRYDCQSVRLSPSFLTFFGTRPFYEEHYRGIGEAMEDALQCVGRLTSSMRDFPSKDKFVKERCNNQEKHMRLVEEAHARTMDLRRIWKLVSTTAACPESEQSWRPQRNVSLRQCRLLCEKNRDQFCRSIDYFHDTRICVQRRISCDTPNITRDGASYHAMVKKDSSLDAELVKLVDFVEHKADQAESILVLFLERLGSEEVRKQVFDRFQQLLRFEDLGPTLGAHLQGKLWKQGLAVATENLGPGIDVYVESMQEQIVRSAYRQRKEAKDVNAVFPPPVEFRKAVQLKALSKNDFCSSDSEASTTGVTVAWQSSGRTWDTRARGNSFGTDGAQLCVEIRLFIWKALLFPRICFSRRPDPLEGDKMSWAVSMDISMASVIRKKKYDIQTWLENKLEDMNDNIGGLLVDGVGGENAAISDEELEQVNMSPSTNWLKATWLNPEVYYKISKMIMKGIPGAESVVEWGGLAVAVVEKNAKSILATLKDHTLEQFQGMFSGYSAEKVAEMLTETFKPFSLTPQVWDVVVASLSMNRLGSGPVSKEFGVHFYRRYEANFELALADVFAANCRLYVQAHFDLSHIVNYALRMHTKQQMEGLHGCCVKCLSEPRRAFCWSSANESYEDVASKSVDCMVVPHKVDSGKTLAQAIGCPGRAVLSYEECDVDDPETYVLPASCVGAVPVEVAAGSDVGNEVEVPAVPS